MSITNFKNEWNYSSTPPIRIRGMERDKFPILLSEVRDVHVHKEASWLCGKASDLYLSLYTNYLLDALTIIFS